MSRVCAMWVILQNELKKIKLYNQWVKKCYLLVPNGQPNN